MIAAVIPQTNQNNWTKYRRCEKTLEYVHITRLFTELLLHGAILDCSFFKTSLHVDMLGQIFGFSGCRLTLCVH